MPRAFRRFTRIGWPAWEEFANLQLLDPVQGSATLKRVGWIAFPLVFLLLSLVSIAFAERGPGKTVESKRAAPPFTLASRFPGGEGAVGLDAWKRRLPAVAPVTIRSTADGSEEHALFYDSGSSAKKPLLVVLHSWSTDWRQNISIPYALFAAEKDWVFIHPDFRGPYRRPEAAASDVAAQDILDAVAYAKAHARVDEDRIYIAGFSGGGMTALAMAGRHPGVWAAVVAWAPVWDIPDWYAYNKKLFPKRHYAAYIEGVCKGAPREGSESFRACARRSPSALLEKARQAGVPVYIGTGVRDDIVPPRHAVEAFNQLADPVDRLTQEALGRVISGKLREGSDAQASSLYSIASAPLYLLRSSGRVTLALFEGGHDVVYSAGLAWLEGKARVTPR